MSLVVRAVTEDDAPVVAALYAPHVVGGVATFEETPPEAAVVAARMTSRPRLPWLLAERDGRAVGYAYASAHRSRPAYRWAADCSVYLARDEQGRGTGQALYEVLVPLVRGLGYTTLHAAITLPGAASVRLHERMGFLPVGVFRGVGFKHGAWHDVGWWQLALGSPTPRPPEPQEWAG